jgi:two-component system response regulator PilR (NtrC family)
MKNNGHETSATGEPAQESATPTRVLVVDDERSMRDFLKILLSRRGYETVTAQGGAEAIEMLGQSAFDLALVDLRMPEVDGLTVLREARACGLSTQIVMMTAYATTQTALDAMKLGAYDYVTKPFKVDELTVIIEKALEKAALLEENRALKRKLGRGVIEGFVGKSAEMREVFDLVAKVAQTRSNVLLLGESGTGKELVARAIHFQSPRKHGPFVPIHCAALPEHLLESELFGHEKGAFTDAHRRRLGSFEDASGGTLFLDEIGEISLQVQVKLLRVLQERVLRRVGGNEEIPIDVRVVAATNQDLEELVAQGRFREDLFYRLNVIQVHLPPLRRRKDDIPLLARHFLAMYSRELQKPIRDIAPDAMDLMLRHRWPGNVRELENAIERAVTLEASDVITAASMPPSMTKENHARTPPNVVAFPEEGVDIDHVLGQIERELLIEALRRSHGVRTDAAKLLGITFRSMRYRLRKHQLGEGDEEDVS